MIRTALHRAALALLGLPPHGKLLVDYDDWHQMLRQAQVSLADLAAARAEGVAEARADSEKMLDAISEYIYARDEWIRNAEADENGFAEGSIELDNAERALRALLNEQEDGVK